MIWEQKLIPMMIGIAIFTGIVCYSIESCAINLGWWEFIGYKGEFRSKSGTIYVDSNWYYFYSRLFSIIFQAGSIAEKHHILGRIHIEIYR